MNIRNTKPEKGNKYYIRKANGGYSNAIQGYPTDPDCNVLSNCVGYAYGRFNEIGEYGYCKYLAPVNVERFIEFAGSCEISMKPSKGACMVWEGKGDLAGHVAIVEDIYDDGSLYISASDYGGRAFYNQRIHNSNGRWGLSANYKFLGFIKNPAVKDEPTPAPTPKPGPVGKFNIGDKVYIEGNLYINSNASEPAGYTAKKLTEITRVNPGSAHPYNTTGDLGWMDEASIAKYIEPVKEEFKVGDKVKPTKLIDYNGTHLVQYDDYYTIFEINGDRVVLVARGQVWAAMNIKNIERA